MNNDDWGKKTRAVTNDLWMQMKVALIVENEESQRDGIYAGTPGRWAALLERAESPEGK